MTVDAADIVRSTGSVATPLAARYLTQLCKHFQHRCPVAMGDASGRITFPMGSCSLVATDGVLTLALEAPDAAAMTQLQDVVSRHLLRFAFRETLVLDWQPTGA